MAHASLQLQSKANSHAPARCFGIALSPASPVRPGCSSIARGRLRRRPLRGRWTSVPELTRCPIWHPTALRAFHSNIKQVMSFAPFFIPCLTTCAAPFDWSGVQFAERLSLCLELIMSQARIRVEVAPGMFSCEKAVSFRVGPTKYSMLLDSSCVHENTITVDVINRDERRALIELPAETLVHGRRIHVPLELLESHDPMRPRNTAGNKHWTN
jgi:hypothetical protein